MTFSSSSRSNIVGFLGLREKARRASPEPARPGSNRGLRNKAPPGRAGARGDKGDETHPRPRRAGLAGVEPAFPTCSPIGIRRGPRTCRALSASSFKGADGREGAGTTRDRRDVSLLYPLSYGAPSLKSRRRDSNPRPAHEGCSPVCIRFGSQPHPIPLLCVLPEKPRRQVVWREVLEPCTPAGIRRGTPCVRVHPISRWGPTRLPSTSARRPVPPWRTGRPRGTPRRQSHRR